MFQWVILRNDNYLEKKKKSFLKWHFINQHPLSRQKSNFSNIPHHEHPTTQTSHIPKILPTKHSTFQKFYLPNILHSKQPTSQTSHTSKNFSHPKYPILLTSYIANIPHPKHPTSWTSNVNIPKFKNPYPDIPRTGHLASQTSESLTSHIRNISFIEHRTYRQKYHIALIKLE